MTGQIKADTLYELLKQALDVFGLKWDDRHKVVVEYGEGGIYFIYDGFKVGATQHHGYEAKKGYCD